MKVPVYREYTPPTTSPLPQRRQRPAGQTCVTCGGSVFPDYLGVPGCVQCGREALEVVSWEKLSESRGYHPNPSLSLMWGEKAGDRAGADRYGHDPGDSPASKQQRPPWPLSTPP